MRVLCTVCLEASCFSHWWRRLQIANYLFRGLVYECHTSVLYCRNAISFYLTHVTVILFSPIRKARPFLLNFMKFTQDPQRSVQVSSNEFHSIPTISVKNKDSHSFTLRTEVWLSVCQFSWNKQLINCIMWRPSILNFTKIGREIWNLRVNLFHVRK